MASTPTFSDIIPSDVIQTSILSLLDGTNLAALSCVSTAFRHHATRHHLFSTLIAHTWPSTNSSSDVPIGSLIRSFPDGPFSFFSQSFPLLHPPSDDHHFPRTRYPPSSSSRLKRIVSAVDISYRGKTVFSRVREIAAATTTTAWFRCSPFRVDLQLEPKDAIPAPILRKNPSDEDTCRDLCGEMTLSWILIDPDEKRAVDLSSFRPVAVQRQWWNEEVVVRFATVIPSGKSGGIDHVMCCIDVTCAAAVGGPGEEEEEEEEEDDEVGELHVREVSMRVEDVDGAHLSGEESLWALEKLFGGKRVNRSNREGEKMRRRAYEEFMERRRQGTERRMKREGRQDLLCIGFVVVIFFVCILLLLSRRRYTVQV